MSLRYRAGPTAARILRDRGLSAETLAALVGPASGPKWIVLAGIDRALLHSGLLRAETSNGVRRLLVGSSAGAWRMLTLAARDPVRAHRMLLEGYVGMRFRGGPVTPAMISNAYRAMLAQIFPPDEVEHLVGHPGLDLATHVVRTRLPIHDSGSHVSKATQMLNLGAAAALQALSPSGADLLFERVLFHTRPGSFDAEFDGRLVRMDGDNLLPAAVATGTVPIYMQPQRDLPGAPRGHYLDGGLSDYHLRQRYVGNGTSDGRRPGITLFPHFQRRIVPVWFDRSRRSRAPAADALDNVLLLYPSDEFVSTLPDARLPERDDFFRFADDPTKRIERWCRAAELGERLGEQLLDDHEAGRIADLAKPFDH